MGILEKVMENITRSRGNKIGGRIRPLSCQIYTEESDAIGRALNGQTDAKPSSLSRGK